ncbi:MAG: hypothetical protein GF329_14140 [Candidatus Lokiarchaeota archaeon]|nr:hypothetical protein [Candidatus Lokiarchaeota archaeon]
MPCLCDEHKDLMYIMIIGNCGSSSCLGNGKTSSSSFRICEKCAKNQNICQVCLKKI